MMMLHHHHHHVQKKQHTLLKNHDLSYHVHSDVILMEDSHHDPFLSVFVDETVMMMCDDDDG